MPLTEEFIHYHVVGKTFTGVLVRDSRNATLPGIRFLSDILRPYG